MTMIRKVWVIGTFLVFLLGCKSESPKPDNRIKIIIDADTANEVDDLFALVGAIANPSLNIKGITSAQFHTSPLASDSTVLESQKINEALVQIIGRNDIALPIGSNDAMDNSSEPKVSPASNFIVAQANELAEGDSLILVILGSCTNVASAILQDPKIIPKIRVHYLGFWHDPETNFYNLNEFNSGNDTIAVNLLLNTPNLDLTVMSATTSQYLVFEKKVVDENLRKHGLLGEYLINRWETYNRWWTNDDPQKEKWIMWDVAIIESIVNQDLSEKSRFATPPKNTPREILIHTKIKAKEMQDRYWKTLENLIK